ncbi:hypothetical protein BKA70DRAFT_1414242 [Coprinopsis sp. MPI-PUGE-AT-0042]|nr:hypothetical protein BKA70DRAFT_1414242 [Coprinopsis sp. MPI-PUGE-AT-0042]
MAGRPSEPDEMTSRSYLPAKHLEASRPIGNLRLLHTRGYFQHVGLCHLFICTPYFSVIFTSVSASSGVDWAVRLAFMESHSSRRLSPAPLGLLSGVIDNNGPSVRTGRLDEGRFSLLAAGRANSPVVITLGSVPLNGLLCGPLNDYQDKNPTATLEHIVPVIYDYLQDVQYLLAGSRTTAIYRV